MDQVALQPSSPVARLESSFELIQSCVFLCDDAMSFVSSIRKMIPSTRHDYIRRRRITRRITTVVLVVVLSVLAGYFITVQPKKAFSPPERNSGAAQADRR